MPVKVTVCPALKKKLRHKRHKISLEVDVSARGIDLRQDTRRCTYAQLPAVQWCLFHTSKTALAAAFRPVAKLIEL